MANLKHSQHKIHLDRFSVLATIPPFLDIILNRSLIGREEFGKILELVKSYPDDQRMIEMVRKAGDASAKVPYLINYGETSKSILEALREVASPHVERLKKLPEPVQATIHTLLSINMVPSGCEEYGIPALLEINQMQKEMTETLNGMMVGRKLAQEFHETNHMALKLLDREWKNVRKTNAPWPYVQSLPEHTQMQYIPMYFKDYLVCIREMCVIVDSPEAQELRSMTPPVLRNPLPEKEEVPVTGSVDWMLRVVGKVGRHFTRALLEIILRHLAVEQIHHSPGYYNHINYESQHALRSFIESNP
jgi:hypothetical protein